MFKVGSRWFHFIGICEIHADVVFSFPVLAPVDFNGFLIQDMVTGPACFYHLCRCVIGSHCCHFMPFPAMFIRGVNIPKFTAAPQKLGGPRAGTKKTCTF